MTAPSTTERLPAGRPPAGKPSATRRKTPRSTPHARRERRAAIAFISPWIVGFLIFIAGPMVVSLVLTFTRYDAISAPAFIGLANYEQALADPRVRDALWNTIFFAAMYVPLSMAVALGLALLLDRVGRGAGVFRTIFYLPVVTPPVAVGILFLLLLNGQNGLINGALDVVGINGPNWTSDPPWIKPGIVITKLWSLGTTVIIYFAALRNVPRQLHEAAMLDGASPWQRFRYVTVPQISGAIFFTLIVNTIASMQLFDEVYTMFFGTQDVQPNAALFYVVYLFQQAFEFLHMGYASTLAWLLFLIIVGLTILQFRLSKRFVHYEGE
jgi:multiple sugar transport system permease protein